MHTKPEKRTRKPNALFVCAQLMKNHKSDFYLMATLLHLYKWSRYEQTMSVLNEDEHNVK